jgi:hypothetical protein
MAALSNYLENALINATLRNTAYSSPATVYVGLFTSDPTDAGSGTEVSGGSYARKSMAFNSPSNGASTNSAAVEFDQATGNWGTITHFAIFDALTTGNMLYHGALTTSKTIETGDVFKFASASVTVTLA